MFEIKKTVRPKAQSCPRMNNIRGKSDLVDHDQHTCEYLSSVSMNEPVTDGLDNVSSFL